MWSLLCRMGEQQSLAVVRLLHARPRFAVLDECLTGVGAHHLAYIWRHARSVCLTGLLLLESNETG